MVCAARGGGRQLVQWFPKDNCKPYIWCRLVPFIWAGVVGLGGDSAQVPLRWSQAQYFSWMSSLFSRNSPHTILNTLFCDDHFHNIPTKCFWRKESYWAVPTFYFWYGSIDKSNFVIGRMVGVWAGGIQKEPRAAHWFFLFQIKEGTSKLTKMAILRKKGTLGSQWQSLINSRI